MITEEILAAIDVMAANCENDAQKGGILALRDMLCDFDEDEWSDMDAEARAQWVSSYLV